MMRLDPSYGGGIEFSQPVDHQAIKWGYAMARVGSLPETWAEGQTRVVMDSSPPRANDIVVSQVISIGRHTRLDLRDTSKSKLFEGDLVGLALSPRYATGQFQAVVPDTLDELHFVCAGGVCGHVSGIPADMKQPTLLRPLGYLVDHSGERVRLGDWALEEPDRGARGRCQVLCVVGSAMDSGKTTAAYSLINGLTRSGLRVGAAKITGTASAKDLVCFRSAGACRVLDFTDAGFAATADLDMDELGLVAERILGHLHASKPDVIVLEIADGITQRETEMLLDWFAINGLVDRFMYTCNDALGVGSGVQRLECRGLPVCGVSGTVTRSDLSTAEACRETDVPVYTRAQLLDPAVAPRVLGRTEAGVNVHVAARNINGVMQG